MRQGEKGGPWSQAVVLRDRVAKDGCRAVDRLSVGVRMRARRRPVDAPGIGHGAPLVERI